MREWSSAWQRRQYDCGWAGIDWPVEYGGRGLSFLEQIIWFEEYVQAGLPVGHSCFVVALAHAGPTLIARGSDEQKSQYLPPILRGETPWCQGFSEPGSGSDLASLSDARRDRRRHARRERPEGLDELRPPRRLPGAPRPHRPERPEAQGHHLGHLRHAHPGDRRPADPDDRRRRPLLRDLLRGRPDPDRQRGRRDQRRAGAWRCPRSRSSGGPPRSTTSSGRCATSTS